MKLRACFVLRIVILIVEGKTGSARQLDLALRKQPRARSGDIQGPIIDGDIRQPSHIVITCRYVHTGRQRIRVILTMPAQKGAGYRIARRPAFI